MSKAPELEGHVYYKPWSTGGNIHNLGSREGGVEGAQVTPTLESWEDWGTFEPCHSRKFIGYYTLNLPFQPVLTTSMTKKTCLGHQESQLPNRLMEATSQHPQLGGGRSKPYQLLYTLLDAYHITKWMGTPETVHGWDSEDSPPKFLAHLAFIQHLWPWQVLQVLPYCSLMTPWSWLFFTG